MRRWQKFGVDNVFQQIYVPEVGNDWSVFSPAYISMPYKSETLVILQKMFGNGVDKEAIYVQCCFKDDMSVDPAADCGANHLPLGYSMIGAFSPLGNFMLNGFIDRNFGSTPPIYKQSNTFPSNDPNG